MASKKLKKYCRIYSWVDAHDKDLAGAIRDLCMEGALSAGRRGGVTFLYPAKEVRAEIVSKAYSTDAEKAVQLIQAHIIPEAVQSPADFRKDVGSRLGVKLEVENVSQGSVTLKGGAQLEAAKDFHPLRRDNMTVWLVTAGKIPLEGPEYKRPARQHARPVKGGAPPASARQNLAAAVEAAYDACQRRDRCKGEDPYLTHAVSLLNFLQTNYSETCKAVLPLIDRDPAVTFYLLVEPYKTQGSDYILDDAILFGERGWNDARIYTNPVSEYKLFFEELAKETEPSAVDLSTGQSVVPWAVKDVGAVRSAVDDVRLGMLGDDGRKGNRVTVPNAVRSVYATLAEKNAIGGLQPVLPDATLQLVRAPVKKLWQDELRFILHSSMQTLRARPSYEPTAFGEIVGMLRYQRPGNDYSKEAALSNAGMLSTNVSPQAEYLLLVKFVNSTDFLYVTVCEQHVGKSWGDIPVRGGDDLMYNPKDLTVYNAEESKQKLLHHYSEVGMDKPHHLGIGCLTAIRHYVARHGRLPPELAELSEKK